MKVDHVHQGPHLTAVRPMAPGAAFFGFTTIYLSVYHAVFSFYTEFGPIWRQDANNQLRAIELQALEHLQG